MKTIVLGLMTISGTCGALLHCSTWSDCSTTQEGRPPSSPDRPRGPVATGERQPNPEHRFQNLMLRTFDSDRDGKLTPNEIEAAPTVLRHVDQNGDGELTLDELRHLENSPNRNHLDATQSQRITTMQNQNQDLEHESPKGTVLIRGGFTTDPQDGGRPVALIAAALGVEPQVFRDAFRSVRPSRSGPPSASRARANKQVLMNALGKHGVTNERLDTVSNYYRYRPQAGELWTVNPASVQARIEDDQVVGFDIVTPGSGYISPPKIVVAGYPNVQAEATIQFDKRLQANGRLISVTLVKE